MSNVSNLPGYLTPVSVSPNYDEALERELSRWIRAVAGLEPKTVFPRWTDPQPKIPPAGTNWCAFGIMAIREDANPAATQLSDQLHEQGSHETLDILCCFYGPSGQRTATQFRDGLFITQNNDELSRAGLTFQQCGRIQPAPELINNQWQRRYDVTVTLRRKIVRHYGIKSLVDAPVKFFGD
ncbi:LIC_12616 family protein [Xenorhabdus budapestensis]|uniref:phage neck terminator protein n=1 Tax=Xenorhabdus budapestensis TaxID=290110 RepID=UPI003A84D498